MNKVSVSTLPMNFDNIQIDLQRISNADYVHVDVMDGKFVEAKTIWLEEVKMLETDLVLDVHLMIMEPEKYVEDFIDAGGQIINFQIEGTDVPADVIAKIKAKGAKVGITISPDTPMEKLEPFLPEIDQVMIMTVRPGKGGQGFIDMTERIREIRKNYPDLDIEVDGGINSETAALVVAAGANILCSGTYVFSNDEPKVAIDILRNS